MSPRAGLYVFAADVLAAARWCAPGALSVPLERVRAAYEELGGRQWAARLDDALREGLLTIVGGALQVPAGDAA